VKRSVPIAAALLLVLLALFEVDFAPRFSLPRSEQRPDPAQEARYTACVEAQEEIIHAETFDRIDNPDVQREILYRRMQQAEAGCREQHPERMMTVEKPLDVNLIDLRWRYGRTAGRAE